VVSILHCLLEGNSVRSTARLCDVEPKTVLSMLVLAGKNCERIMGRLIANVPVTDVQCDEIWGYVYKKEAHKLPMESDDDSIGDAYCFIAIERHSKLVLNFALGRRSQATRDAFIEGLRAATAPQRFQISTDGFKPYVSAISTTLSDSCDFAQVIKVYAQAPEGERRYSPAEVATTERKAVMRNPDKRRACTSHVERQNLTHGNAPPYAVNRRVQQELGESLGRILPALRLLQLLPDSANTARHACNGSWDCGSGMGA
jgi:hypothetical protein